MLNISNATLRDLDQLEPGISLIIAPVGESSSLLVFNRRGVIDLFDLYKNDTRLDGALALDKVVGLGAATLIIALGIKKCLTRVISHDAKHLLEANNVEIEAINVVPFIENHSGTGRCPVETILDGKTDINQMIALIREFLEQRQTV